MTAIFIVVSSTMCCITHYNEINAHHVRGNKIYSNATELNIASEATKQLYDYANALNWLGSTSAKLTIDKHYAYGIHNTKLKTKLHICQFKGICSISDHQYDNTNGQVRQY